jgi:hypothetical protein
MQIEPSQFKESGLYLLFPDGTSLALTNRTIEERSKAILSDPDKISPDVKEAQAFQLCTICPKRGSGDTCHAIRPVLAFWENIDRYFSYEEVTAVYRDNGSGKIVVADTTLQKALQYVSILSLMYYCEMGKTYWKYFCGVHPLMDTDDVVIQVYLNMFWATGGNVGKTRALIGTFNEEITTTTRCQMDRIKLFCDRDPFLNALVMTQVASEFLALSAEDTVRRRMLAFDQSPSF